MRTDRYKYIQYVGIENMHGLYDLVADPYELRNVIDHPCYGEALNEMRSEHALLLEATS